MIIANLMSKLRGIISNTDYNMRASSVVLYSSMYAMNGATLHTNTYASKRHTSNRFPFHLSAYFSQFQLTGTFISKKKWQWHQVEQACNVVYLLTIGSFK